MQALCCVDACQCAGGFSANPFSRLDAGAINIGNGFRGILRHADALEISRRHVEAAEHDSGLAAAVEKLGRAGEMRRVVLFDEHPPIVAATPHLARFAGGGEQFCSFGQVFLNTEADTVNDSDQGFHVRIGRALGARDGAQHGGRL